MSQDIRFTFYSSRRNRVLLLEFRSAITNREFLREPHEVNSPIMFRNPSSLDLGEAFVHVINEHRWLAASACSWNLVGPKAHSRLKTEAHDLLPNIDVAALDSVLLHARALIDFYSNHGKPQDILLRNFGRSIAVGVEAALVLYKRPIEVHLLHITNWRDRGYRLAYSQSAATLRPDWNQKTSRLVRLLHSALRSAASAPGDWRAPFKELYSASKNRCREKSFVWPKHLGESSDVLEYLDSLNL